ncbi:MAG: ABC transporter permease [Tepidisphaeraceae bacterium]|jgi:putative ABC transport system permease protein
MLFWMIVKVALKSLMANKLRSILAMLGIIIGVGAVIAMLAIGTGAQQSILTRITAMGTNYLVIRPGQRGFGGVMSGSQQNLTVDDAKSLLKIPHLHSAAPVVGKTYQIKYFDQNTLTTVTGTSSTYLPMRNFEVEHGRNFNDAEIDHWSRVAILGPVTATNLFGLSDPVGEEIKVNGINFRVIGVLKAKGDQGWFNPDDQVLVPYTTAMHILMGLTYVREIDVDADEISNLDDVQDSVTQELRNLHKVQPGAPDDVNIQNQAANIDQFMSTSRTLTFLLGAVAGISLLVGGIGIMNIMLVTVTERTREIGIRKAIGARGFDILSQFLVEAILMSGVGGMVGVLMGIGVAHLVDQSGFLQTTVTTSSVVVSVGFSAVVGIFFGFYPATRAAKLDPIEALRYE